MSRCDVNHCDFDVMSKGQFSSHGGVNSRVRGTLGMMTASMMTARVITTIPGWDVASLVQVASASESEQDRI